MVLDPQRFQESLERAKPLRLEGLIKDLSGKEEQRGGRRAAIEQRRQTLMRQIEDPLAANVRLERILQGNELTDIAYLAQGVVCARSVCRIVIRRGGRLEGYGTGFLVAPGILMTNHHVLPSPDYVKESIAEFRYERDLTGAELDPVAFGMKLIPEPIIFQDLDFVLVAVEPRSTGGQALDQFGWLKLNVMPNKALIGEYLTIIQHPNGERKQVCVRENKLIKYSDNGPFLWYQTDTVGGSSGSPVFNNAWEVVGLHHSGVPRTAKVKGKDVWLAKNGKPWDSSMSEDEIDWMANEGVRISFIASYLRSQKPQSTVAQAVLAAGEPRPGETVSGGSDDAADGGIRIETGPNGRTRVLVPIDIDVNVGKLADDRGPIVSPRPAPDPRGVPSGPRAIEKVVIKRDYPKRNGFQGGVLGAGAAVALPKVTAKKFGKVLPVKGKANGQLKYWNYTVVMNADRRLAFFSAATVDASRFRGNRDADGDTWYDDTRLDAGEQVGKDFYKKQKAFEADRSRNPFDQGHLSRRSDLQWGGDDDEAKRNGDDSYHYPNCAPQHWQFNQNNKASGLWFRLEEMAIVAGGGKRKLCVINGPVFDAPISTAGADGLLRLNVGGTSVDDGTFGGVAIPKQFFKVIAWRDDSGLRAKAFVVTQESLLTTIDRYYPAEKAPAVLTDLEVRLYQVRISDLEKLTGLDFGALAQHDTPAGQEATHVSQGLPIEDESQIVF